MRIAYLSFIPFLALATAEEGFKDGDSCGVMSADFLNPLFEGSYLVAGEAGCTLESGDSGCHCAPDFADGQSLSEWKWQCNNTVTFGPAEGKVCPATVPVEPGFAEDLDGEPKNIGSEPVFCNTTIHPTGHPGNEVCGYSTCDEGGNTSAICGCVDLEARGIGEGQQWFCLHATCDCMADVEEEQPPMEDTTSSAPVASTAFALAASAMFLAMMNWGNCKQS